MVILSRWVNFAKASHLKSFRALDIFGFSFTVMRVLKLMDLELCGAWYLDPPPVRYFYKAFRLLTVIILLLQRLNLNY